VEGVRVEVRRGAGEGRGGELGEGGFGGGWILEGVYGWRWLGEGEFSDEERGVETYAWLNMHAKGKGGAAGGKSGKR
jgi:hypothetical protein